MPNAKISKAASTIDPEDPTFGETEEHFRANAREAMAEYERTGLHLTQDEVEEWMKKRARGERAPMPKLHT